MSDLKFNSIFERLEESASMKLGLESSSHKYLNLSVGSPDIQPPSWIIPSTEDLEDLSYQKSRGSLVARRKVLEIVQNGESEKFSAETEMLLVPGAKAGIFLALKALADYGDRVLLLEPYWLSFPQICNALNLEILKCSPFSQTGGDTEFDIDAVSKIIAEQRPKVFIINNPNNPNGFVHSPRDIILLAERMRDVGGWLLVDEVYKDLIFSNSCESRLDCRMPNIVRVGSFSKSLSAPGLRAGYLLAESECVDRVNLLVQHFLTCISSTTTRVLENLSISKSEAYFKLIREEYAARCEALALLLRENGVDFFKPQAGFYFMISLNQSLGDGNLAAEKLRDRFSVLVTPGVHYGESYKDFFRVSLVAPSSVLNKTFGKILSEIS